MTILEPEKGKGEKTQTALIQKRQSAQNLQHFSTLKWGNAENLQTSSRVQCTHDHRHASISAEKRWKGGKNARKHPERQGKTGKTHLVDPSHYARTEHAGSNPAAARSHQLERRQGMQGFEEAHKEAQKTFQTLMLLVLVLLILGGGAVFIWAVLI